MMPRFTSLPAVAIGCASPRRQRSAERRYVRWRKSAVYSTPLEARSSTGVVRMMSRAGERGRLCQYELPARRS